MTVDGRPYSLSMWVTSSGDSSDYRYERLRAMIYPQTHVFLVCFSISDVSTFVRVRSKWVPEISRYEPKVPWLLVGTKSDLRSEILEEKTDAIREVYICIMICIYLHKYIFNNSHFFLEIIIIQKKKKASRTELLHTPANNPNLSIHMLVRLLRRHAPRHLCEMLGADCEQIVCSYWHDLIFHEPLVKKIESIITLSSVFFFYSLGVKRCEKKTFFGGNFF